RGHPPDRWFAQRAVLGQRGELGFAGFTAATHATAVLSGAALPWPRHTPPSEARLVARWLGDNAPAILRTYPSSAVRVVHAAGTAGIDLDGTLFSVVGEPITPAKQRLLAAAGARVLPDYFITEAGQLASACTDAGAGDDMHVLSERVAVTI